MGFYVRSLFFFCLFFAVLCLLSSFEIISHCLWDFVLGPCVCDDELCVLSSFAIILLGEYRADCFTLSYDVESGSEITPCNKIDKPSVV